MNRHEKWLRFLLLFGAGWLLLAAFAIFLPTEWMAAAHQWLSMGEFSDRPLTGYLTRSIAALYAYHGAMVLLAATDIRRYLPLIRLIGFGDAIFGITMFGIDLFVGMPWF